MKLLQFFKDFRFHFQSINDCPDLRIRQAQQKDSFELISNVRIHKVQSNKHFWLKKIIFPIVTSSLLHFSWLCLYQHFSSKKG